MLPCWCGQRLCATDVCHCGKDQGAAIPAVQVLHVLCIASCVALSLRLCMAPRAIHPCAPQYLEEPIRGVHCTLHPYSSSIVCPNRSERAELPQLSEIKFKTLSSSQSVQGTGLSVCNQTPWLVNCCLKEYEWDGVWFCIVGDTLST